MENSRYTLVVSVEFERSDAQWESAPAIIDTGAAVCCISSYHPALINREIHPSRTTIKGVDGNSKQALGTVKIPIRFGGQTSTVEFEVMTNEYHELILSFSWFRTMKLTLTANSVHNDSGLPIFDLPELPTVEALDEKLQLVMKVTEPTGLVDNHHELNERAPQPEQPMDLNIGENVTPEMRERVTTLFTKFFANSPKKLEPVPNQVWTQSFIEEPRAVRQHNLSEQANVELEAEIKKLHTLGVIEKVDDPASMPSIAFFSVLKPNGRIRLIADSRVTNSITSPMTELLQPLESILFSIKPSAKYFSLLDVKSAYYVLTIDENSRRYFRFKSPDGLLYQFCRAPMGARNSSTLWCRFIFQVLHDVSNGIPDAAICTYMDDIVCQSTNEESMYMLLEAILKRLEKYRLKLNAKLHIMTAQIEAFGYTISENGRMPLKRKLNALTECPLPETFGQLHTVLSGIGYYRSSLKAWGETVAPFWPIITANAKRARIEWDDNLKKIYKNAMTIARNPLSTKGIDYEVPFRIHTDASVIGLGGALLQKMSDGTLSPVAFYSRGLTRNEKSYSLPFLEVKAVEQALLRWEVYLGIHPVEVYTDSLYCYHLMSSLKFKSAGSRSMLVRALNTISRFNVSAHHVSGKSQCHLLADLLSRCVPNLDSAKKYLFLINADPKSEIPITVTTEEEYQKLVKKNVKPVFKVTMSQWQENFEELETTVIELQKTDAKTTRKIGILSSENGQCKEHRTRNNCKHNMCYVDKIKNGLEVRYSVETRKGQRVLMMKRGQVYRLVIPDNGWRKILEKIHSRDHCSAKTMFVELQKLGLTTHQQAWRIAKIILECKICGTSKASKAEKTNAPSKPIPLGPWEDCGADLTQWGQGSNAQYILICVCNFTKAIWATALHTATSKSVICGLSTLWSITGCPHSFRTDNGPCFSSTYFKDFTRCLNIKHYFISPGNSRANGVNESAVKRFQANFRKLNLTAEEMSDPSTVTTAVGLAVLLANSRPVGKARHSPMYSIWLRDSSMLYSATVPDVHLTKTAQPIKGFYEKMREVQLEQFNCLAKAEKAKKKFAIETKFVVGDTVRIKTKPNKFFKGSYSEQLYQVASVKRGVCLLVPVFEEQGNEPLDFTARLVASRFLKKASSQSELTPLKNTVSESDEEPEEVAVGEESKGAIIDKNPPNTANKNTISAEKIKGADKTQTPDANNKIGNNAPRKTTDAEEKSNAPTVNTTSKPTHAMETRSKRNQS